MLFIHLCLVFKSNVQIRSWKKDQKQNEHIISDMNGAEVFVSEVLEKEQGRAVLKIPAVFMWQVLELFSFLCASLWLLLI